MSDSRKEFEAWWEANSERLIYENDPRRLTEEGWQAARRAALEEAADTCERLTTCAHDPFGVGWDNGMRKAAECIRALAAQTGQEGK